MVEAITRSIRTRRPNASCSEVEWLVRSELERFRDARITQFIPVLVERAVLARLPAEPAPATLEVELAS
jgi:hypothetical protein